MSNLFDSFCYFSLTERAKENLSDEESYDRHEESEEVWWHREYLFPSYIELDRYPRRDTHDHREESRDGVDFFQYDSHNEWDERSCKSDLVRVLHHSEYIGFFMFVLVGHECDDDEEKTYNCSTSHGECFFV